MPNQLMEVIVNHLFSLADEGGGFAPSPEIGYLGIADSRVSDLAATVYAAEIAQTLGVELPYPDATAEYIRMRQQTEGYFRCLEPRPGVRQEDYYLYQTCMGVRGLKALGHSPRYDPLAWMERQIRSRDTFEAYHPDFFANTYAALETPMPDDCAARLRRFLLSRQDPETGWIIQTPDRAFELNNPMTFHAARVFHLTGGVIPHAKKILDTFMKVQKKDGSWSNGNVHGNFDACVAIRILSDNSEPYREAVRRAAEWALKCRNPDGGFSHFGDRPSEVDAAYFHVATLVMAGMLPSKLGPKNNWIGWGHTLISR